MPDIMTIDPSDFVPPWLSEYIESLPSSERDDFRVRYEAATKELVEVLAESDFNKQMDGREIDGEYSVVLSNGLSINIKKSLLALAVNAGPLLLLSTFVTGALAPLGIVFSHPSVFGSLVALFTALSKAVHKLSMIEMGTYLAVAAAIKRNKDQRFDPVGANFQEILDSFDRDKMNLEKPNDLKAVLDGLVGKDVLARKADTGIERYYLAF
ncbi:MAG TPA: hypothetical protein VIE43_16420 [Thermoanaerobaculia bacterium]|jgi:hypothetical protein|nr:hypothetical protein [Thermoanaerobaculia bacterium]